MIITKSVNMLSDTIPCVGAGVGFYLGYTKMKNIRYNMPKYPNIGVITTIGGPAFIGYIVPKVIHSIITSNTTKAIVCIAGGCYLVNMIEYDKKDEIY